MNQLLKKYQNLFNLNDWILELNVIDEDLYIYAETEYNSFSKQAYIDLNKNHSDIDIEKTIIHELLHLIIADINDFALNYTKSYHHDILRKYAEHCVIKLENAFWNIKGEK